MLNEIQRCKQVSRHHLDYTTIPSFQILSNSSRPYAAWAVDPEITHEGTTGKADVIRMFFHRNDLFGLVCAATWSQVKQKTDIAIYPCAISRELFDISFKSPVTWIHIGHFVRGNPQRRHHSISRTVVPLQYKWISPSSDCEHFGFAATLRNVTLCSLVDVRRRFWRKYYLHLDGRNLSEASNRSNVFRLFCDGYLWLASSVSFLFIWRWRQNVRPKLWCTSSGLHGVTSRKITLLLYIVNTFCRSR
jgi:hypothetical protein